MNDDAMDKLWRDFHVGKLDASKYDALSFPKYVEDLDRITASKILQDQHAKAMADRISRDNIRRIEVEAFKKTYIKIRSENIVLSHENAIELVKMIYKEAAAITYEDIV